MSEKNLFQNEKLLNIKKYKKNMTWVNLSHLWLKEAFKNRYMYNFECLGRPIIQTPIDMIALHEIVWNVKPDLIIETGIAHGGSLIYNASLLALLDVCDGINSNKKIDPNISKRKVIGIDIDIRQHNKIEIQNNPMHSRIMLIEGSSIDKNVIVKIEKEVKKYKKILVCLDSNHTTEHVAAELNAYSKFVSKDSYCIVFDTIVNDMPKSIFKDRPWGPADNPKIAVKNFLKNNNNFIVDEEINNKLMISVAPDGYLKRIK